MSTVTAQLFLNELDLMEIKMHELRNEVDAHIIVEADHTFTGIPKPLVFHENRERFAQYNIIYHVIEGKGDFASPWDKEYHSHCVLKGLVNKVNPEIAIWLDADELPRRGTVERFKESGSETCHVDMDKLLFYFNRFDPTCRATTAKIGRYNPHADCQPWRGMTGLPVLDNAGWHCSYFGSTDELPLKLQGTSHAIEDFQNTFANAVKLGVLPGLERTTAYDLENLPEIASDPKYTRHFLP